LRSWLVFEGPIRNALHKLKYRQNVALGDALGSHLAGYLRTLDWPVELVVPIPLGKTRLKERGYNQVGLVARSVASVVGLHYSPRSIFRVRETESQVGLSIVERKENVADAFRAMPELVAGKTVLLVDDVATTGATLASCAQALLLAGAQGAYALTIARALPHHGLQNV
jgi:ComF family protein